MRSGFPNSWSLAEDSFSADTKSLETRSSWSLSPAQSVLPLVIVLYVSYLAAAYYTGGVGTYNRYYISNLAKWKRF